MPTYDNALQIVIAAARKGAKAELELHEAQAPEEHLSAARANHDVVMAACDQVYRENYGA